MEGRVGAAISIIAILNKPWSEDGLCPTATTWPWHRMCLKGLPELMQFLVLLTFSFQALAVPEIGHFIMSRHLWQQCWLPNKAGIWDSGIVIRVRFSPQPPSASVAAAEGLKIMSYTYTHIIYTYTYIHTQIHIHTHTYMIFQDRLSLCTLPP